MTRELLLLRHGKSDWTVNTNDFGRPLKERGKRGAQKVGSWLAEQHLVPDLVLSSPAERTLLTAQKCCKAMGLAASNVQTDETLYLASLDRLLGLIRELPDAVQRVLLVGHNPGLEQLLIHLSDTTVPVPADGKLMPTSTLARIQIPVAWAEVTQYSNQLVDLVREARLPKDFPFLGAKGSGRRERPAYYYTQSSVIPYRFVEGELQLLIVRSSKKKHWVVPKGIADPGVTLQRSAAKEAREEAGVEGIVADVALGSYRYSKWGAMCEVTVFPMEVTKLLPEREWEEQHRGRRWVSPEEAVVLLKESSLGPLVLSLEQRLQERSNG